MAFMVKKRNLQASANPLKEAKVHFRTGIILDVKGDWYWLTAGHILEDIDRDGFLHPTQIAEEFKLLDSFGTTVSEKQFQYIPFAFEGAWKHYEHSDKTGIDYGIVALGSLEKKALQKNNITPIVPKLWTRLPKVKLPFLFVLGFPSDQIKPKYADTKGGFSITAKPIPTAISMTMHEVRKAKKFRLYAKVPEEAGELDGFSGGPVFVVTDDGYEILALQSGWERPNRLAFVCPLGLIGPRIAKAIRNRTKKKSQKT
ncbi:MAG TPA: hypothetical protein VFE62_10710 [Gemmataceae bacterium]|nr:hypothetical protein [Gemmataceae bacterium]